eukprot:3020149-Alexandrium_andersonii.AAC.1
MTTDDNPDMQENYDMPKITLTCCCCAANHDMLVAVMPDGDGDGGSVVASPGLFQRAATSGSTF